MKPRKSLKKIFSSVSFLCFRSLGGKIEEIAILAIPNDLQTLPILIILISKSCGQVVWSLLSEILLVSSKMMIISNWPSCKARNRWCRILLTSAPSKFLQLRETFLSFKWQIIRSFFTHSIWLLPTVNKLCLPMWLVLSLTEGCDGWEAFFPLTVLE